MFFDCGMPRAVAIVSPVKDGSKTKPPWTPLSARDNRIDKCDNFNSATPTHPSNYPRTPPDRLSVPISRTYYSSRQWDLNLYSQTDGDALPAQFGRILLIAKREYREQCLLGGISWSRPASSPTPSLTKCPAFERPRGSA